MESKMEDPQFPANLGIFTEEILNRKFHILCSGQRDKPCASAEIKITN